MQRRWAGFAIALVATAWWLAPAPESEAADVPTGSILVIVAHPDDDVITASGVMAQAGGDVTVVYATNGDRCESPSQVPSDNCPVLLPGIGTTRQAEAVSALEELGLAELGGDESNLIFMGYPNGFIGPIRCT